MPEAGPAGMGAVLVGFEGSSGRLGGFQYFGVARLGNFPFSVRRRCDGPGNTSYKTRLR